MQVIKKTGIDWLMAMSRLSIGSFFLLNILYRHDIEISDHAMMEISGLGLSTHRKHKKELIDCKYLAITQVGRGEYQYTISNGDI